MTVNIDHVLAQAQTAKTLAEELQSYTLKNASDARYQEVHGDLVTDLQRRGFERSWSRQESGIPSVHQDWR